MYLAGFITFIGLILLLSKINRTVVRKALGYDLYIDIILTFFVAWLLKGTYSGMIAAMLAGLAFTVTLYTLKQFIGYEKLRLRQCVSCKHSHWTWEAYPPAIQKGLFGKRIRAKRTRAHG